MKLKEIVEQLKSCGFECEAGMLEKNVAFMELEKMAAADDYLKRFFAMNDYAKCYPKFPIGTADVSNKPDYLEDHLNKDAYRPVFSTKEELASWIHENCKRNIDTSSHQMEEAATKDNFSSIPLNTPIILNDDTKRFRASQIDASLHQMD